MPPGGGGNSLAPDGGTYTITGTAGNYPPGYTCDTVTGAFTIAPALVNDGLLYASLAPELALENRTFSLGYSFYYDLGYQEKFPGQDAENSRDGQFRHKVAPGTSRTWEIAEKFSFAGKPVLNLGFYSWDGVCSQERNPPPGVSNNVPPQAGMRPYAVIFITGPS